MRRRCGRALDAVFREVEQTGRRTAMTVPPSRWRDNALDLAVRAAAIAVLLYIAARLILAVLPVLLIGGGIVLLGFAGWSIYQFRKSRW